MLHDGQGLASYRRYYLASNDDAKAHPEVLQQVFAELQKTGTWVKAHPAEAAKLLGPLWGNLDVPTVELANSRRTYQVEAVKPDALGVDVTPRLVTLKVEEPPKRSAGIKVPDVATLVNKLKNEAKVI